MQECMTHRSGREIVSQLVEQTANWKVGGSSPSPD